jgi:hypothetical protein
MRNVAERNGISTTGSVNFGAFAARTSGGIADKRKADSTAGATLTVVEAVGRF